MTSQKEMGQTLELEKGHEPLCPELREWVQKMRGVYVVLHPYFTTHLNSLNDCGYDNDRFRRTRAAVEKALVDLDWELYLVLHERRGRVRAFLEIMHNLDAAAYWTTLAQVYMDCEFPHTQRGLWPELFESARPHRELLMSDGERKALAEMPDPVTIYRGSGVKKGLKGWSWTLDAEQAKWFAVRFEDAGWVATATVAKKDVVAYLTERDEEEILVNPKRVTILHEDQVEESDL